VTKLRVGSIKGMLATSMVISVKHICISTNGKIQDDNELVRMWKETVVASVKAFTSKKWETPR